MTPQTPKPPSAWTALKLFLAGLCVFVACARTPEMPQPALPRLEGGAGALTGIAGQAQAALRWPRFSARIAADRSGVAFTPLNSQPGDAALSLTATGDASPTWDALTRTLSVSVTLRNTSSSETYRNLRGLLESLAPQGLTLPLPSGLNAQGVPFMDLGTLEPGAVLSQTWRVTLPGDESASFEVALERNDTSLVLSSVNPSGAYNDLDTVITLRGKGFTAQTQFFLGEKRLEVKSISPGEVKLLVPSGTPPAPGGIRAVAPDGSRSSLANFALSVPGETQRGRYTLRVSDDFSSVTVDQQGGSPNAPLITAGKPAWDPATHILSVDLTLTNPLGGAALPGLRGVLTDLTPNNVSLTLPSGFTAQQAAFLDLGVLTAGQSATRTWRFSSPENKAFSANLTLERFDDALSMQYAEPSTLLNDQDTSITLFGRGFRAETRFFIESTALEVLNWSVGVVTVRVPRGFLPSAYGIMAVNPEGTRTVLYPALTIQNPPRPTTPPVDNTPPVGPVGKIGLRSFIEGYVYDFKTKQPLEGANVFVSQCEAQAQTPCAVSAGESGQFQRFSAVTDSTGYYFLRGVPSGRNVVRIEKEGYEALYRIAQNSGEARTLALKLAELEPRAPGKTRIGASGGVHYANNGSFLKIPAGALDADVDIDFTQLENANTLPELPQNGYFLAFARLGPVGLTFKKPATLFLPLEPGAVLPVGLPIRISYYDVRTAKWVVDITSGVIAKINGRLFLEYEINHFTWIGGMWNPRRVTGRLVFDDGTPAGGVVTNFGTTDENGYFTSTTGAFTSGRTLELLIADPFGGGIVPTTTDDGTNGANFGTITLPNLTAPVVYTPTVITTDGFGPCALPGGISAQSANPFSKFSALESAVRSSAPSGLGLAQSNTLQAQSGSSPDVSIFFQSQIEGFGVNLPRYSRQKLDLSKLSFKWQGKDITEKSVMAVDENEQLSFTHKTSVANYGAKLPLEMSATNKKGNPTVRKRDIAVIDKIVAYKPKFVILDDEFVDQDLQTPYALRGNSTSKSQIVVLRKSDLERYYLGTVQLIAEAVDNRGQTVSVTSSSRFGYGSFYDSSGYSSEFEDGFATPPTPIFASEGSIYGDPTETPYLQNPDPSFISSSSSGTLSAQGRKALEPQSCGGSGSGYGYGYGEGTPPNYIPTELIITGGDPEEDEPTAPEPIDPDCPPVLSTTSTALSSRKGLAPSPDTLQPRDGNIALGEDKLLLVGPEMVGRTFTSTVPFTASFGTLKLTVNGVDTGIKPKFGPSVYIQGRGNNRMLVSFTLDKPLKSGLDVEIALEGSQTGRGFRKVTKADVINSIMPLNVTALPKLSSSVRFYHGAENNEPILNEGILETSNTVVYSKIDEDGIVGYYPVSSSGAMEVALPIIALGDNKEILPISNNKYTVRLVTDEGIYSDSINFNEGIAEAKIVLPAKITEIVTEKILVENNARDVRTALRSTSSPSSCPVFVLKTPKPKVPKINIPDRSSFNKPCTAGNGSIDKIIKSILYIVPHDYIIRNGQKVNLEILKVEEKAQALKMGKLPIYDAFENAVRLRGPSSVSSMVTQNREKFFDVVLNEIDPKTRIDISTLTGKSVGSYNPSYDNFIATGIDDVFFDINSGGWPNSLTSVADQAQRLRDQVRTIFTPYLPYKPILDLTIVDAKYGAATELWAASRYNFKPVQLSYYLNQGFSQNEAVALANKANREKTEEKTILVNQARLWIAILQRMSCNFGGSHKIVSPPKYIYRFNDYKWVEGGPQNWRRSNEANKYLTEFAQGFKDQLTAAFDKKTVDTYFEFTAESSRQNISLK